MNDMKKRSLWDFVDPNQPWVLSDKGSFLGFFNFVPEHYRFGPWYAGTSLSLGLLGYVLVLAATWMQLHAPSNGWLVQFQMEDSNYQAFTYDWYYNLIVFSWMFYVCCNVIFQSPLSFGAWISYTLWSWTAVTLRHLLSVLAPFVPSVRLANEILRFPALLSASITTIIWNFVLFPAIIMFFMKDAEQRTKFIGYFTNFRLTQLHVFNIFFAVANGALVGPFRPLHLGDFAAAVAMMVTYMVWYYCILDRLGIHMYPIFSPRTPLSILSLGLVVAACVGGYLFWKDVLEE